MLPDPASGERCRGRSMVADSCFKLQTIEPGEGMSFGPPPVGFGPAAPPAWTPPTDIEQALWEAKAREDWAAYFDTLARHHLYFEIRRDKADADSTKLHTVFGHDPRVAAWADLGRLHRGHAARSRAAPRVRAEVAQMVRAGVGARRSAVDRGQPRQPLRGLPPLRTAALRGLGPAR